MRHANNLESVLTYEGTSEIHQLVIGQQADRVFNAFARLSGYRRGRTVRTVRWMERDEEPTREVPRGRLQDAGERDRDPAARRTRGLRPTVATRPLVDSPSRGVASVVSSP